MAELSGGGLRVLIVEDNPGDAHLARRTLREIGVDFST
jgi:hypothetical protein